MGKISPADVLPFEYVFFLFLWTNIQTRHKQKIPCYIDGWAETSLFSFRSGIQNTFPVPQFIQCFWENIVDIIYPPPCHLIFSYNKYIKCRHVSHVKIGINIHHKNHRCRHTASLRIPAPLAMELTGIYLLGKGSLGNRKFAKKELL